MGVEIALLGPPRVTRDGRPVVFDTRKALALLALLALSDGARSRAALIELLYPGHDPDRGRGALRRTLSALRSGVGEEWVETVGDGVGLRRGPGLTVDVHRFRELGALESTAGLEQAVTLFPADFLEGFALRDNPAFDDWALETAESLRAELGSVLRRVIGRLVEEGSWEEAIVRARRWLALDPLHEPAHRELIRLYAWKGNRAAALEQYRTCVRTLNAELGVPPLAETAALYAQINDGSLEAPARASVPAPVRETSAAPGELPLTGREADLDLLLAGYEGTGSDGALVVIEGEAGIGKTRLAAELVARARAAGGRVLQARCHEDEAGLPYGPVVELLREALEDPAWADALPPQQVSDASLLTPALADLLPEGVDVLPLEGPGAPVRLVESLAAVLGSACSGTTPGVLLLDDVHAADDATLDAITYLARRLAGRPLLLVLTWRSERVPVGHRLRGLVAGLARDGRATIVGPGRLEEDDVAALVRSALGPDSTPALERRVHVESEGVPLFVVECLAALAQAEPGAAATFGAPSPLVGRLGALSETARQVLDAAAVIGRSFDLPTLRRAGGRSEEETVASLEELVGQGWVRETEGRDTYDFAHQKLRELVYASTALARRQLLHRRVARALTQTVRSDQGRAAVVAHHLQLAGDPLAAAREHRAAAEHAASLYAHADAAEHLEEALGLGDPDVSAVNERLGELRTALGDYAGAVAAFEVAAAYVDEPSELARLEHRLGTVQLRRGQWRRAADQLRIALDRSADDAALRPRVLSDLALATLHDGHPAKALALAEEALALAGSADDRWAQAQAHNMLGMLARHVGSDDDALEHLGHSLRLARGLGDAPAETAALNNLALVHRGAGRTAEALELTRRALELCSRYGDRHREAALENNLADLHHDLGQEALAMDHLKRAVVLFSEIGADEATRLPEIWKLVSW